MQHHPNNCSLTTTGEKMQHIFQISSMGCSLTNNEDTDRATCAWSSPALLARADGRSSTWLMSEQAGSSLSQSLDTPGRHSSEVQTCSSSSLLWRPPLQNPCRTPTPDNSLKRHGGSIKLHIYYNTSVTFGVEILPTPLPFSFQIPPFTVKDQPYKVLRLLKAFQLGSSSIHWVKGLSWKPLESRSKHTVYRFSHSVSLNHLILSPKGHNRRFKK